MNNSLTATTSTPGPHERHTVSEAVVSAVANSEGVRTPDLQPLATVIDPDALEKLVAGMASRSDEPAGNVEFSYSGYNITVTEVGNVSVTELEAQG